MLCFTLLLFNVLMFKCSNLLDPPILCSSISLFHFPDSCVPFYFIPGFLFPYPIVLLFSVSAVRPSFLTLLPFQCASVASFHRPLILGIPFRIPSIVPLFLRPPFYRPSFPMLLPFHSPSLPHFTVPLSQPFHSPSLPPFHRPSFPMFLPFHAPSLPPVSFPSRNAPSKPHYWTRPDNTRKWLDVPPFCGFHDPAAGGVLAKSSVQSLLAVGVVRSVRNVAGRVQCSVGVRKETGAQERPRHMHTHRPRLSTVKL